MHKAIRWPLQTSSFTDSDRRQIADFFLNPDNKWTQGKQIYLYEQEMAGYAGTHFAMFVSSGSAANTLLAMHTRDTCGAKNIVVLPAVTWQTSCAPWIREGFTPKFIDVSRTDFSMNLDYLEIYLRKYAKQIACVFVTSLLGYSPDIERLQELVIRFNVNIMLDNCEAAMTMYNGKNVSNYFTSTTSTYFAHHIQSVEGGFILTNDEPLYKWCAMARNHGMSRSLDDLPFEVTDDRFNYRNQDVDSRFDFYCLGSNFRGTDITAFIGRLDLRRSYHYASRRLDLYERFSRRIDSVKYYVPHPRRNCYDVPFAIPILRNNDWESKREELVGLCRHLGIETRPILSGNLLRHTAYKDFKEPGQTFSVADVLHSGVYVGLNTSIEDAWIDELVDELNAL